MNVLNEYIYQRLIDDKNTINIEEILEVISQLEKAEQTADICDNARFTPNSVVPSTVAL